MNSLASYLNEGVDGTTYVQSHGQDVIYMDKSQYHGAVLGLKEECEVSMCLDVTAVDFLGAAEREQIEGTNAERFNLVANFISHKRNERIRIVVPLGAGETEIDSIADIFPGANFGEREAYDMFGVIFNGHPDLTRILMPDEWEGFPLRKDDAPARIPVNFTDDLAPRSSEVQS